MTHEETPPAPASEAAIQELIALERDRTEREEKRRSARQSAIVWIVAAVLILAVLGGVLYSKAQQRRESVRTTCEFAKVLNGYSVAEAELACK